MIQEIMSVLKEKGYEVIEAKTIKNGVEYYGISLGSGTTRPTFYPNANYSVKQNVDHIISQYKECEIPNISVKTFTDWKYVKDNVMFCLQRPSNEDIVKESFLDMELYFRIKVKTDGMCGTTKLTNGLLNMLGVSKEELFEAAKKTLKQEMVCCSITALLLGQTENNFEFFSESNPLIIITNKEREYGASGILFKEKLMELATYFNDDLVILPSSIHEILIIPCHFLTDFDFVNMMISSVNNSELELEEVLSNHAYIYKKAENEIFCL